MPTLIDNDARLLGASVKGFGARHIVRATETKVFALHINESDQLEIHLSTDGGYNWSLLTTFTGLIGIIRFPTICYYGNYIVVGWVEGSAPNFNVRVYKYEIDVSWTDILTWSFTDIGTYTPPIPVITFNKQMSGRLHVFVPHHNTSNALIIKNKYTDTYGSSWIDGTNYSVATIAAECSLHDIDSRFDTGIVTIAFRYGTTTTYYFYHFTTIGVYASNTTKTLDTNAYGASCAYDSSNNLRFATLTGSRAAFWDGAYVTDTFLAGMISIGIDGADNVYVFYTKTNEICYYKKWTKIGATWGSETALTTGDGQRIKCEQKAISYSAYLHLVYFSD